jgi:hypothetical protein
MVERATIPAYPAASLALCACVSTPASAAPSISPLVLLGVVILLAGLDLAGSILAKEWAGASRPWAFAAGLAMFAALFTVYAVGLRYAEMSTVTFGWIVVLQVGVLLVERFRYGVDLPNGKWVAIAAIVALQGYLVLAPTDAGA